MPISRRIFLATSAIVLFLPAWLIAKEGEKSDILLAQIYQRGIDVTKFLVSEKYDGVRAIWDGKILHSRAGNVIQAPAWFTKDLPKMPLDGELWLARGKFDALSGAVRKDVPIDAEWREISYMIFELPNAADTFEATRQTHRRNR